MIFSAAIHKVNPVARKICAAKFFFCRGGLYEENGSSFFDRDCDSPFFLR